MRPRTCVVRASSSPLALPILTPEREQREKEMLLALEQMKLNTVGATSAEPSASLASTWAAQKAVR